MTCSNITNGCFMCGSHQIQTLCGKHGSRPILELSLDVRDASCRHLKKRITEVMNRCTLRALDLLSI